MYLFYNNIVQVDVLYSILPKYKFKNLTVYHLTLISTLLFFKFLLSIDFKRIIHFVVENFCIKEVL